MIFGGDKIEGYQTFPDVMYSMFRITLVDDYGFEVSTHLFQFSASSVYLLSDVFIGSRRKTPNYGENSLWVISWYIRDRDVEPLHCFVV